jgi:hypothetical protein
MRFGEELSGAWTWILAKGRSNVYLVAIIIVAILVRFYSLASTPSAVWSDELIPFSAAFSTIHHAGPYYSPTLYAPTTLITITLFGELQAVTLLGPTTLAIRAPGAFYGVGVVLLTYLLSHRLFGPRVALWAAALASVDPIAVQASRVFYMSQSNIALFWLLLGTLLIYDSILKSQHRILRLLGGGVAFGFVIGFYFTDYGKITALTVLLCLFVYGLTQFKSDSKWSQRLTFVGVPLAIIATIVVGIPQLNPLVGYPALVGVLEPSSFYFGPNNLLFSGNFMTFAHQYLQYFSPSFLFISGDTNPVQNTGLTGEFLFPSAIFLYVGLIVIFKRLALGPRLKLFPLELVVLWIITTPIESAAFVYNNYPDSASVVLYTPMLEMVAAIGIVSSVDYIAKVLASRSTVQRASPGSPDQTSAVTRIRLRSWRRRIEKPSVPVLGASVIVLAYAISTVIFANAYFVIHDPQVVDEPTSYWGMLYGYPEMTQYIVGHHLTDLPLYESMNGLFGNSTSWANFFYYTFHVPLSYLYYYSGGLITQLSLANVSSFYANYPSLILSGSYEDLKTLEANGVIAKVIDTIVRPDGALAMLLIETTPGLLPPQAAALNNTLLVAQNVPQSIANLSSTVALNQSFSLSVRFSVAAPPSPNSTSFENIAQLDYNPGLQLAGLRLAPASLQPGGGSAATWALNAYVDLDGFQSNEYWPSTPIADNTTYSVTLTFSNESYALYVDGTAVLSGSVNPLNYTAGLLGVGSSAVPVVQEVKVWGFGLTGAQVAYAYLSN